MPIEANNRITPTPMKSKVLVGSEIRNPGTGVGANATNMRIPAITHQTKSIAPKSLDIFPRHRKSPLSRTTGQRANTKPKAMDKTGNISIFIVGSQG
jgi:hypothetical protein